MKFNFEKFSVTFSPGGYPWPFLSDPHQCPGAEHYTQCPFELGAAVKLFPPSTVTISEVVFKKMNKRGVAKGVKSWN